MKNKNTTKWRQIKISMRLSRNQILIYINFYKLKKDPDRLTVSLFDSIEPVKTLTGSN